MVISLGLIAVLLILPILLVKWQVLGINYACMVLKGPEEELVRLVFLISHHLPPGPPLQCLLAAVSPLPVHLDQGLFLTCSVFLSSLSLSLIYLQCGSCGMEWDAEDELINRNLQTVAVRKSQLW